MFLHLSLSYFLKELVSPSLLFLSSSGLLGDPHAVSDPPASLLNLKLASRVPNQSYGKLPILRICSSREVENHCLKIGI
jgi:hypothetical protein